MLIQAAAHRRAFDALYKLCKKPAETNPHRVRFTASASLITLLCQYFSPTI
jgi:hypothetical protein